MLRVIPSRDNTIQASNSLYLHCDPSTKVRTYQCMNQKGEGKISNFILKIKSLSKLYITLKRIRTFKDILMQI